MKYLFVGAGAMGSALACLLVNAGNDVAMIARGENLTRIQELGITLTNSLGETVNARVDVYSEVEYDEKPDVVVLCVKSYSLEGIIPFLCRVLTEQTIVMPFLNVFDMRGKLSSAIGRSPCVLEAKAYIAVELKYPGVVSQKLRRFRIVMGGTEGRPSAAEITRIAEDFRCAGATVDISTDMFLETILKFIRVSTLSAAEVYYNTDAAGVRENPAAWKYYHDLGDELVAIAVASGLVVSGDPLAIARESVSNIRPDYTTSLMHDYRRGRPVEAQAQFFDVFDLGRSLGLDMPAYGRVSARLGHVPAIEAQKEDSA